MTSCLLSSVSPDDEIFQTRSTFTRLNFFPLNVLHSEWPKLYGYIDSMEFWSL